MSEKSNNHVKTLNDEQLSAVEYNGKSLLISAGPGAGKTFVLIERIKYLLSQKNVEPESILVITFTRKAANQLKERLSKDEEIGEGNVNKMFINTIHSFCISFLSENGFSDIDLLESNEGDERKLMFLRKHKVELGFNREAYMSGSKLRAVVDKFDEYTTFNVDTKGLVDYIEENYPVSDEYEALIAGCGEGEDFEFPYDEVYGNDELKTSYYNACYQAVAKAYPVYLDLLEEEGKYDFNYLQLKVRDILLNDSSIASDSRFKNIFIDEYQDIDPIQNDIFGVLEENADTFTVVGDDDQSIYSFRGSVPKYFTDYAKEAIEINDESQKSVKYLSTNFRSCPEIVEYNEELIKNDRTIPKELTANRTDEGGVYYLLNDDVNTQAEEIAKLIHNLKETDKIKQYSDVAILVNSINYSKGMKNLLDKLTEYDIEFNLSENTALMENDDVKAMIILMWYMKEENDKHILSKWEREWLNLKAFASIKDTLKLDETTCEILTSIEEKFQKEFIAIEHEVYKEVTGEVSRIRTFKGVFNSRSNEIIDYIFERIQRPDLSMKSRKELIELGITNEHDLDLFEKLNNLKARLYDESTEFYEKPSVLNVYYDILEYSGLLEGRLENTSDENERVLRNLGKITETISNYEEIVTKYSINGLLWFIFQEFDRYSSPSLPTDTIDKVQIMTVHKSKGLEFPVVILASIIEDKFPKVIDLEPEKLFNYGQATYPTPIKYLEYKKSAYPTENSEVTEIDEVNEKNRESKRVFYVGSTRAKDILILSSITDNEDMAPQIMNQVIDDDNYSQIKDNFEDVTQMSSEPEKIEKDRLKLSYTHLSEYNNCGQEYNLRYNYQFKTSKTKQITFGQVAHTIVNLIHQKQIQYQKEGNNKVTNRDEVKEIIDKVKQFNQNIKNSENDEFNQIEDAIYNYWANDGSNWHILGSEVPFSITHEDYDLEGKIDLIIKDDNSNDITIIDFKTTNEKDENKLIRRYQKQFFTYAMAIKQLPEFDKYNIKEAMIYSVKFSKKIPVPITDMDINDINNLLDDTVENILAGNFKECEDRSKCFNCEYNKSICRRK